MSSQSSRIAELAAAIAHHATRVDKFLAENNLPQPSFDVDGPVELGLPFDVEESRVAVLRATQELHELLQGPRELIFNHQVCGSSTDLNYFHTDQYLAQHFGTSQTNLSL